MSTAFLQSYYVTNSPSLKTRGKKILWQDFSLSNLCWLTSGNYHIFSMCLQITPFVICSKIFSCNNVRLILSELLFKRWEQLMSSCSHLELVDSNFLRMLQKSATIVALQRKNKRQTASHFYSLPVHISLL